MLSNPNGDSARISNQWFCSATMHDGLQLLLAHVPHLLKDALVICTMNADLTRFWLNISSGLQHSYPKIEYENRYPSSEMLAEIESWQLRLRKYCFEECNSQSEYGKAAIPSHSIQHDHSIFGVPQFPRTACMQLSFLCPLWDDLTLCIHTIVAYSLQPQYWY